jgi:AraC-like DNA-binding protein
MDKIKKICDKRRGVDYMPTELLDTGIPTIECYKHVISSPEWLIEYKITDCIDLTYIVGGQAIYTINRSKVIVEEGDLLCIPKGSERSAVSNGPAKFECYAVDFNLTTLGGEELTIPLPLHIKAGIHNDLILHYQKLKEDFLSRGPGHIMRARARLMLVIQRIMEMFVYEADTVLFDPRIKQSIRYIKEHYAEPLTITAVAAVVSLSPVYFGTLFKRETDVTFRDYLNTIRINQAEHMLRTGKWNVTEVAGYCGFADVFYFSRLFKKHKGIPPSVLKC